MKGREERERYTQLNVEFQRTVKRDKKAFLNEKCKVWSSLQTGAWWTRVDEKKERKREKEASIPWVTQRTNKALGQGLCRSWRHRAPS